jgi:glycosyltransferase involved in cell wall biosynthesis
MKVSVLTTTYNRCEELEKLYTSLVVNAQSGVDFEWLIMDDGSTDKTKVNVQNYIKQNIFHIEYYYQKNQGKMAAINNLMEHVNGDICFTCDSDDQLTVNCMDIIKKHSKKLLNDETVYALLFLKKINKKKISGKKFPENDHRSDMFSLYFRENITGEKILVFKTSVRKKYKHELVDGEKFITEARMYHKMDEKYGIKCYNTVIVEGEYLETGYTHNIIDSFKKYPKGY